MAVLCVWDGWARGSFATTTRSSQTKWQQSNIHPFKCVYVVCRLFCFRIYAQVWAIQENVSWVQYKNLQQPANTKGHHLWCRLFLFLASVEPITNLRCSRLLHHKKMTVMMMKLGMLYRYNETAHGDMCYAAINETGGRGHNHQSSC